MKSQFYEAGPANSEKDIKILLNPISNLLELFIIFLFQCLSRLILYVSFRLFRVSFLCVPSFSLHQPRLLEINCRIYIILYLFF
jgi:hypothetical protein